MLISADVAHAIHPNYPDKHEKHHQPSLNKVSPLYGIKSPTFIMM